MEDLLALEATGTGLGAAPFAPASPLKPAAWRKYLATHPNQCFASYIVSGTQRGFHIGVNRAAVRLNSADRNLRSVSQNPQVVEQYVQEEVQAFHLRGAPATQVR